MTIHDDHMTGREGSVREPNRVQLFFARGTLGNMWLIASAVFGEAFALLWSEPNIEFFTRASGVFWLLVGAVIAPVAGVFALLVPGYFLLWPVYLLIERMNGGPFKVGDVVMVLAGPYRGRIGRIYGLSQGNSVCVALGLKEQKSYEDIFGPIQLLRQDASLEVTTDRHV
ncbi:MAG: KOW motif-containing protein [Pyrinomonadaceae bacterium]|nr:KOW motif-containing protein [Phycisphaerales bacterium]